MPEDAVVISLLGAAPAIDRSVVSAVGSVAVVAGMLELAGTLEVVGAETGSFANAESAESPVRTVSSGLSADVGAVAVGSAAPRPLNVEMPPLDAPVDAGSVVVELCPAAAIGITPPVEVIAAGSTGSVADALDVGTTGVVSDVLLGDGDLFLLKRPNMEVRFDLGCASSAVVGLVVLSATAASFTGASLSWWEAAMAPAPTRPAAPTPPAANSEFFFSASSSLAFLSAASYNDR